MKFFGYLDCVMSNVCASKCLEMFEIHVGKAPERMKSILARCKVNACVESHLRISTKLFRYLDCIMYLKIAGGRYDRFSV